MKSASSQLIMRLIVGVFVILVFLLNTLSAAGGALEPALVDNKDVLNIELENKDSEKNEKKNKKDKKNKMSFVMPTADTMEMDTLGYKNRVAGTDKWNDLILKVSLEEDIDPIFVKCIMALESAGDADLIHYNKNNTYDSGLMQVNSTWASSFDLQRLTTDYEYAIRCGIKIIKLKIAAAERNGKIPTAHEVAWRYNGYCEAGRKYANKFITLYNDLSKNTEEQSIILSKRVDPLIKLV